MGRLGQRVGALKRGAGTPLQTMPRYILQTAFTKADVKANEE